MSRRLGLYEFLSVGVEVSVGDAGSAGQGTTLTFTSSETYDDDPETGSMMLWAESTIDTRTQNETYDDDPGLDGLGDVCDLGSERPTTPPEARGDAPAPEALVLPTMHLDTTLFTKVVGETHDDDGVSLQLDA